MACTKSQIADNVTRAENGRIVKDSLKSIAASVRPVTLVPAEPPPRQPKSYPSAATRIGARQISGHFQVADVVAFRTPAATHDIDVQELLAEAINMVFERYGLPSRITPKSGRRTRQGVQ